MSTSTLAYTPIIELKDLLWLYLVLNQNNRQANELI